MRAIPKSDEGWSLPGISYILPPTIGGRLGEWFEAPSYEEGVGDDGRWQGFALQHAGCNPATKNTFSKKADIVRKMDFHKDKSLFLCQCQLLIVYLQTILKKSESSALSSELLDSVLGDRPLQHCGIPLYPCINKRGVPLYCNSPIHCLKQEISEITCVSKKISLSLPQI